MELLKNSFRRESLAWTALLGVLIGALGPFPAPASERPSVQISAAEIEKLNSVRPGILASEEVKKSQKLILYFWATWCPDCREKLTEHLPKLTKELGVPVLSIATDRDLEKVQAFIERLGVSIPVLWDPEKKLRGPLRVLSVPSWAALRKTSLTDDWQVVNQGVGGTSLELRQVMEAL